jgi:hypothetical protein
MAESVVPLDIGVVWDPNAPEAVLAANDMGVTALALYAHSDDEDQNPVVLVWRGSHYSSMGDPNDEALSGHRLYSKGLDSVAWVGQVHDSELVVTLEKQNSAHTAHDPARFAELSHYIVLTKEQVVEVVARGLSISRVAGRPRDAVIEALR